ncbi:hypothetical protein D3H55_07100 [Bacillus salacetis]|uniref:Uncharacterized protein n=1 Tax=Bacillus salacetis TaxID=2315464 RepID=A0A3A1R1N5_9BACI|nr:hypothetical protein [Bacillus salacetis]RIW35644.1 hypothetical protein D3H55_07100 [Bacillus salacetis]
MVSLEPYVYFSKVNINDYLNLPKFFQSLLELNFNNKEGFFGYEELENSYVIRYFKVINSFELAFDSTKEKIISEETPKIIKGEIRLNCITETMIIWGVPKLIKSINNIFKLPKPFELMDSSLDFKGFYRQLSQDSSNITEITFKDIKISNKYIPLATFATTNSNDALELISSIGAQLINTKVELFSSTGEDHIEMDINLKESFIKLHYSSISQIFIEEVKDLVDNLEFI